MGTGVMTGMGVRMGTGVSLVQAVYLVLYWTPNISSLAQLGAGIYTDVDNYAFESWNLAWKAVYSIVYTAAIWVRIEKI